MQGDGRYAATLPFFGGLNIWKANPLIVDKLREVGALLHAEKVTHSYMHCWRHKTPIIYRATTQWFAGMDDVPGWRGVKPAKTLRETALAGIEATQFFPAWGKARLHGMIANRPDWTLSRQRQWGVPLPFFVDRETDMLHPDTLALLELAAAKVRARRHRGMAEGRPTRTSASTPTSIASSRIRSTSGSIPEPPTRRSWAAPTAAASIRGSHPDQTGFPADLYLEGSDQHRGWFHSSLLSSCMLNGVPPYKALLTHGFAVDGEGKKMSKSKGNVVAPQTVSDTLGAEILRLWVGATDYSGELSISNEILKRVVESYRRIRNTLRFLLANTSDFDPARDAVPAAETARARPLRARCGRRYFDDMRQNTRATSSTWSCRRLQLYCSEDLGGRYLDILKDRLYTTAPTSPARRSAQTVLDHDPRRIDQADGADSLVHRGRGLADRLPGKMRRSSLRPGAMSIASGRDDGRRFLRALDGDHGVSGTPC